MNPLRFMATFLIVCVISNTLIQFATDFAKSSPVFIEAPKIHIGFDKAAEADPYPLPNFTKDSRRAFLSSVDKCIAHIKYHNKLKIPNVEVLKAQAALESGWGSSRFATEGNNLFGIRTFNLKVPHIVPESKPKNWGVRAYDHECDSVKHYIKIINNGKSYSNYRKADAQGMDALLLVDKLTAYAEDKKYFVKVKAVIKKIRRDYND